ncbi:hypothetical protein CONPUDRAFT_163137 [Coniophora puteana RWD-64-598 SS2]|uniref:Uncharacterized protein n=1 Tax=Coniophora puteana (strain RWD-64-598) TaxID=741705 RepID=A0A5M3MXH8_CONPW|nr:uncharacterized protein CONPUDRAFT_163137 [Coniophora puteana RWD-64-598 SS2]EIW83869.1 hypothetical protein CONPUDRAFT_163137 [Coniophora puteana RWD-64-598 SS2]
MEEANKIMPPFNRDKMPQFTRMPNPAFTWEKDEWTAIDSKKEDPQRMYKIMIGGVCPRPIAFISTRDENGVDNISPYSGFTVNIVSEPFLEQVNASAVDAPFGFSEWELCRLIKAPTVWADAPRVKESAFSMECELYKEIEIIHPTTKKHTATTYMALVKHVHVRNDMWNERGNIELTRLRPVSRSGDISFTRTGDGLRVLRPQSAKEEGNVRTFMQKLKEEGGVDVSEHGRTEVHGTGGHMTGWEHTEGGPCEQRPC